MKNEDLYFRCRKCRNPSLRPASKNEIRCQQCGEVEADPEKVLSKVRDVCSLVEISQQLYHRDLTEQNIRELLSMTKNLCSELSELLVTPTKSFQDAIEWKSALVRRIKCSKRPATEQ